MTNMRSNPEHVLRQATDTVNQETSDSDKLSNQIAEISSLLEATTPDETFGSGVDVVIHANRQISHILEEAFLFAGELEEVQLSTQSHELLFGLAALRAKSLQMPLEELSMPREQTTMNLGRQMVIPN